MRVRFPRIAFLFACAVSLALPLAAQSTNGTINGRVLDPSNKVIGGADNSGNKRCNRSAVLWQDQ